VPALIADRWLLSLIADCRLLIAVCCLLIANCRLLPLVAGG
jgi:hypothetical protein